MVIREEEEEKERAGFPSLPYSTLQSIILNHTVHVPLLGSEDKI